MIGWPSSRRMGRGSAGSLRVRPTDGAASGDGTRRDGRRKKVASSRARPRKVTVMLIGMLLKGIHEGGSLPGAGVPAPGSRSQLVGDRGIDFLDPVRHEVAHGWLLSVGWGVRVPGERVSGPAPSRFPGSWGTRRT